MGRGILLQRPKENVWMPTPRTSELFNYIGFTVNFEKWDMHLLSISIKIWEHDETLQSPFQEFEEKYSKIKTIN